MSFLLLPLEKSLLIEEYVLSNRQTDMEMSQDTSYFRPQFSHHKIGYVTYGAFILMMEPYVQRLRESKEVIEWG